MKTLNENKKVVIKDLVTNEFYCVKNQNDLENSFPLWSKNINSAYDFESELIAKNELNMNDLTQDGKRKPEINIL